ncbi:Nucleotidyltransferase [Microthyrium microscopicum]|uniref:DNA polymerase n=1 Tax=Microthyrium microscopicum TaxID=703497 RepID=A0A6A6U9L4_9PEZI|nr:Nucleotidyltransferase [Microthyrium microscopicum]
MSRYYDRMHDNWRTLAYRKAIATLRRQNVKVVTKEQAKALPNIGSRIAEKIEEIALTSRLQRLNNALQDPRDQVLQLFTGIYGVGLKQASLWVEAGHRTLEDLKNSPVIKLTANQTIGIEHYDDLAQRIPRDEVAEHGEVVRNALQKIDPSFQAIIGGSYRRGAANSGDIDMIITKSDSSAHSIRTVVLDVLVPTLMKKGFLKFALAASKSGEQGDKWHGLSCLLGSTVWRRIDLLIVPSEEIGAALLYFTGNDIFNRSIRLLASKKGLRLNQRGLYKNVIRGVNRAKLTDGELVEGKDEKEIFRILGVPWRAPEDRNC